MKLLIITRKVDDHDERMSFFVEWINEFAKHVDKLYVMSMQPGSTARVADNVEVHYVQKTNNSTNKFQTFFHYIKLANKLLKTVDTVFIHMIPRYVNIIGPLLKVSKKPVYLWYTHKSVNLSLRMTQLWLDGYITASKESFRMKTKKPVHAVGHAINIEKLRRMERPTQEYTQRAFEVLTSGRISPSKRIGRVIEAIDYIAKRKSIPSLVCTIQGAPALKSDQLYKEQLEQLVKQRGLELVVRFVGAKPHQDAIVNTQRASVFINLSATGSLDKSVLEAMAAGVPVITSNEAFRPVLQQCEETCMIPHDNARDIAQKIIDIYHWPEEKRSRITSELQRIVSTHHALATTIKKIISLYE